MFGWVYHIPIQFLQFVEPDSDHELISPIWKNLTRRPGDLSCLVMFVTKRDRWESTSQGRVMCEHYKLNVLMYTPVMFDFPEEEDTR